MKYLFFFFSQFCTQENVNEKKLPIVILHCRVAFVILLKRKFEWDSKRREKQDGISYRHWQMDFDKRQIFATDDRVLITSRRRHRHENYVILRVMAKGGWGEKYTRKHLGI